MRNRKLIKLVAIDGVLVGRAAGKHQSISPAKRGSGGTRQCEGAAIGLVCAHPSATDPMIGSQLDMINLPFTADVCPAENSFKPFQGGAVGCPGADEEPHCPVSQAGPTSDLSHREIRASDAQAELARSFCDRRHGAHFIAAISPQSSAEIAPRAKIYAIRHNRRMATFKSNIERMVGIIGSQRKLAERGDVNEKTIRNWLSDEEADSGSRVKHFAKNLNLPRSQLVGEQDIPESWWEEFRRSVKNDLRGDAISILRKTPAHKMTAAQREALASFVSAFKSAAKKAPHAS